MHVWPWSRAARDTAEELYGAIVTQSRRPAFFAGMGVEDTPEGRAAVIILNLVLVLDRLAAEGPAGQELGRRLTEAFVTDMDDCLREMGVGDLAVPRKVRKAAAAAYDRFGAYRRALDAPPDAALIRELAETVPGVAQIEAGGADLARYMRTNRAHLAGMPSGSILAGHLTFVGP